MSIIDFAAEHKVQADCVDTLIRYLDTQRLQTETVNIGVPLLSGHPYLSSRPPNERDKVRATARFTTVAMAGVRHLVFDLTPVNGQVLLAPLSLASLSMGGDSYARECSGVVDRRYTAMGGVATQYTGVIYPFGVDQDLQLRPFSTSLNSVAKDFADIVLTSIKSKLPT